MVFGTVGKRSNSYATRLLSVDARVITLLLLNEATPNTLQGEEGQNRI